MNPILPAIVGFGKIARPHMRIFMALEPQRSSILFLIGHDGARRCADTHRRQKANRDNAATEAQQFGSET
jgi:hypothetical protein